MRRHVSWCFSALHTSETSWLCHRHRWNIKDRSTKDDEDGWTSWMNGGEVWGGKITGSCFRGNRTLPALVWFLMCSCLPQTRPVSLSQYPSRGVDEIVLPWLQHQHSVRIISGWPTTSKTTTISSWDSLKTLYSHTHTHTHVRIHAVVKVEEDRGSRR